MAMILKDVQALIYGIWDNPQGQGQCMRSRNLCFSNLMAMISKDVQRENLLDIQLQKIVT